jgi:DNA-directed RNA polymerase specialized sigma24 family protein
VWQVALFGPNRPEFSRVAGTIEPSTSDLARPVMVAARKVDKVTPMADGGCFDVVRFGGDLGLAPEDVQDSLAAHLANCGDCASYVSQIVTTRELLGRHSGRGVVQGEPADGAVPLAAGLPTMGAETLRIAVLRRAELLDPSNAEDLAQRSLEVGLALERRDSRPRGIAELIKIMHTLSDAQMRLEGRTAPAIDVTADARARADSLEDLDGDADEPALLYPDLYPGDDELDGWVDSPNQWRGGAQILGPEEVDETGEIYDVLDRALGELPEPLGELLALVDLQGHPLAGSAHSLGLDEPSATAALARARNHVRGRLNEYLTAVD